MPSPPGGAKLTSPWVSAPSPASYKTIEPGLRFHSVSLRPRMYWETIRIRACGTRTQRHTPYSSPYHRHTQLTRYTLHPSSTHGSCPQTAACTCGSISDTKAHRHRLTWRRVHVDSHGRGHVAVEHLVFDDLVNQSERHSSTSSGKSSVCGFVDATS